MHERARDFQFVHWAAIAIRSTAARAYCLPLYRSLESSNVELGAAGGGLGKIFAILTFIGPGLAVCATQQAMTVDSGAIVNSSPKYRNAMAVRSVTGGQLMNAMTVIGVTNEPLKAALEGSLATNGYLARSGTPKFYVDAEIVNLDEPVIGLDLDVTADVTYKVSGSGAPATYPIKTTARTTFSDSPRAADRVRIANERAMQQNIKQFLQALR